MFPIKYIDNNLVWNKDNEVFAYYELIPYNYSFLSAEQKFIVHDSFRQLIAQSREGKIHALQIATESSIRSMQEQSKKLVTGKLKEVAYQKIDEQTEALVSMIGDNQVDYRFFLGFKLMVTEEQLNLKNIKKSAWLTFTEFLHEVNHTLMNDFVSMPNDEINRYMKMEKLLENKISRRFKVRRLEINDFGYLMEHLYGRDGIAYEDYEYQLPKKKLNKETLIKYYDLIRPTKKYIIAFSEMASLCITKASELLGENIIINRIFLINPSKAKESDLYLGDISIIDGNSVAIKSWEKAVLGNVREFESNSNDIFDIIMRELENDK